MDPGTGLDRDEVGRSGRWVPPGPGATVFEGLDLSAQTARLRVLAWRAVAIAVLWVAPFAGGVLGMNQLIGSAEHLLETGTWVAGTVVAVSTPAKGSWTIDVRYPAGGTTRTEEITLDSDRPFAPGQSVMVVYDPADPTHVRTEQDENLNQGLELLTVILILSASVGTVLSFVAAIGWFRRHRSSRRTGWHPASVRVLIVRRTPPHLTVNYSAGGTIYLRAALSSHSPPHAKRDRPHRALVGGEERSMVVLFFPEGKTDPRAVPARAEGPRTVDRRIIPAKKAVPRGRTRKRRNLHLFAALLPIAVAAAGIAGRRRFRRRRRG